MSEKIDQTEYEHLFPYNKEFDCWVDAVEQRIPSILVQRGRDRFLFESEGTKEDFSPFNTCNS